MNPVRLIPLVVLLLLTGCAATGPGMVESSDLLLLRDEAENTYEEERYAEALPLFQSLVEQVPQDADIWFRLGNIHARLNQPRHAIHAYEEALVREPRRTKAWHNLGVIHLRNAANAYSQLCINAPEENDPLCRHAMKTLQGLNGLLARPLSPPSPSDPEAVDPMIPDGESATAVEPVRPTANEPARESSPEHQPTDPMIEDGITSDEDVDPADIPGGSESPTS